ncbi:hypothetical protein PHYBOEH_001843 [Phytophthora boehmeriae]|uniref:RxLR effector protein n=1 Tax=Phytophthora boehmeriae TaxID=109152 RepID=A0A8T1V518_9STRA|nr:hypothetical protein PHYBOEH_001843 [Phytophthora boehmeriae]
MYHRCYILAVLAVALVARSNIFLLANASGHTKRSTATSSNNLPLDHHIGKVHGHIKVITNSDNYDDDDDGDTIGEEDRTNSEERVNPLGGFLGTSEIKGFLRREYNNIAPRIVAKTNKDADDIADAIWKYIEAFKSRKRTPVFTKLTEAEAFRRSAKGQRFHEFLDEFLMKQVNIWLKEGKSIDFVKKELRIHKLTEATLKKSPNFKYYDDFMSKTATEWARDLTSIDDAKKLLGMEKLSADALKTHANYKYYDKFMDSSVLMWVGGGKSIDDVQKLLGLETLSAAAFKSSANFKYYDKFMTMRVEAWLRSGKPLDDVKTLLGFKTLSADATKLSPNLKYYDQFLDGRVNNIAARSAT